MAVPAITATTASTQFDASFSPDKATNRQFNTYWVASTSTGWLRVQYATAFAAKGYWLLMSQAEPNRAPKDWTFEGSNNGTSWTTLDTRTAQTAWATPQSFRYFAVTNTTAYTHYRLNVTANNGDGLLAVNELWLTDGAVSAGAGAYPSAVLADSPLWFYRWSEPTGDMAEDVSGNHAAPASLKGTFTRAATGLIADGDPAVTLATNGYAVVPDHSLNGITALTIDAVIKTTNLATYNAIVNWDAGSGFDRNLIFRVDPNGALTFVWWSTAAAGPYSLSSAAGAIVVGNTYHVAVTHTGSVITLYVNGSQVATTTQAGGVRTTHTDDDFPVLIGAQAGPSLYFIGTLDDVAVYGTALSGARIAAHASAVSSSSSTTVTAPVLSLTADVLNPTVNAAASGVTVTAPVLSLTADVLNPAVGTATPATVAVPVLGVTVAAPAPAVSVASSGVTVTAPRLALTVATPMPAVVTETEEQVTGIGVIVVEGGAVVTLTAASDLPGTVPVLRESYVMPPLTQTDPVYQPRVDYPVIREEVGTVHLWIGGVDVTYFRGVPTELKRWDSEAPFGDKTAVWEMPQLEPWERPGYDALAFMRKDAKVVIGYVSPLGVVTEEWVGFYHSRSRNVGDARSSVFEAKGEMWAAMHMPHEPLPYMPPTDIGIVIPRLLNKLPGRRFPRVREVITGIKTRTRGARDQWVWQVVQDIFAEAWTDDGRQWTLHRGQLALKKAMSVVDAEVAWGTPLVDIDLVVDEDSRVDGIFARGKTKGGGEWANVFYPGAHILTPPPFPNDPVRNINIGATDASTDTGRGVSDWQRKVNALGRWGRLAVDGVFGTTDSRVLREIQDDLGLTVDGSLGPQSWEGTFGAGRESIDLTPVRLPLVVKPTAWPTLHDSHGVNLGPNPQFDETIVPHFIPLDLGTNITRSQGKKACKTYLAIHGEASATGSVEFIGDPNNVDRTKLGVGDNLRITGLEGRPVVVQFASKTCELDGDGDGRQLIVRFDFDERARDALTLEQILDRNRSALADPARRPGNPNRQSRNVRDEGYAWDEESPCGELERVAVNGASGLWTIRTIPVAEFGSLASIILESDYPFAMAVFANTRITPNVLRRLVGNPFASTDPFRPHMPELEKTWGLVEAWGAQDDACGYSPLTEKDPGATFTRDFVFKNDLEYITDGLPYLSFAFYFRGGSGFVDGRARPARSAG